MKINFVVKVGLFNEIVPSRFMDEEGEYSGRLVLKDMVQGIREGKVAELVACEFMNGVSLLMDKTFIFIPQSNISALFIDGVFDANGTDDESAE